MLCPRLTYDIQTWADCPKCWRDVLSGLDVLAIQQYSNSSLDMEDSTMAAEGLLLLIVVFLVLSVSFWKAAHRK